MIRILLPLLLLAGSVSAQQIAVADQTFRMDGIHEFPYAFAAGDSITLYVHLIAGSRLKTVEVEQVPGNVIFQAYALDTILTKVFVAPQTGAYIVRLTEAGRNKKICRFTLHRKPSSARTARIDTRVNWDLRAQPQWIERKRSILTGRQTNMISTSGQVTIKGSKMGLNKARNSYQFYLPPNTVQWAYRLAVEQQAKEARRQDAEKFRQLTQTGATKIMKYQPETALAAFALGMAIDMTTSTGNEDVEYAIVDGANLKKFQEGESVYDAYIWQGGVSVDVQRRFTPLSGPYYFALKNNNLVDDINVSIDIEVVTETPVYEEEIYLEKLEN